MARTGFPWWSAKRYCAEATNVCLLFVVASIQGRFEQKVKVGEKKSFPD
jgi:hypothetical protein